MKTNRTRGINKRLDLQSHSVVIKQRFPMAKKNKNGKTGSPVLKAVPGCPDSLVVRRVSFFSPNLFDAVEIHCMLRPNKRSDLLHNLFRKYPNSPQMVQYCQF